MTDFAEAHEFSPHVLIGHDGSEWARVLRINMQRADIGTEEFTSPVRIVDRLSINKEPHITAVVTDAFDGQWRKIYDQTRQIGASAILLTKSTIVLRNARSEGILAFSIRSAERPDKIIQKETIEGILSIVLGDS
jgi:hypothetical protein